MSWLTILGLTLAGCCLIVAVSEQQRRQTEKFFLELRKDNLKYTNDYLINFHDKLVRELEEARRQLGRSAKEAGFSVALDDGDTNRDDDDDDDTLLN